MSMFCSYGWCRGRDTKMAWPFLCTYLRGEPRKIWNPYSHIRILPRLSVCIACESGGGHLFFDYSPCFLNRTIPKGVS